MYVQKFRIKANFNPQISRVTFKGVLMKEIWEFIRADFYAAANESGGIEFTKFPSAGGEFTAGKWFMNLILRFIMVG